MPSTHNQKQRSVPTRAGAAYVSLLAATDRLKVFYDKVYLPLEITGQQYNVLRILRGAGSEGLPTLTIAERMIERTPGITRLVDRLESLGLVTRQTRKKDRRYVDCKLTKKGLELLETLDEPVAEANQEAFASLDPDELETLIALLAKLQKAHESA